MERSYFDIYKLRLNRFGLDYQSRVQGQREFLFEDYLLKTLYRVEFWFKDQLCPGSLERYKQDETETMAYLLTRIDLNMPNGTVIETRNQKGKISHWMVFYLEEIHASGYNRYIMLKMTHFLTWRARDKQTYTSWAYLYGQEDNMLKDELKSRSRMDALYTENLKSNFFIMPTTAKVRKDDYFIIGEGELEEYYRVTGYDIQSTPGVMFVTIDPVYEFDLTPAPEPTEEDKAEEFFWITGGNNDA